MAFLNGAPLSVTIFTRLFHLHIISSNSYCPIDLAFSSFRALAFIRDNSLHLLCTIYLQPFEGGFICTVSVCKTWKIDGVCITTGGSFRALLCLT